MTTTTTTLIDLMLRFSPDEVRALFESESHKLLGISGAEFIRRRDAGEFHPADDDERAKLSYLTTLSAAAACPSPELDSDASEDVERTPIPDGGSQIVTMTPEETLEWFDREARTLLGISGEEFLRRWDAGEFRQVFDTPGNYGITHLGMLADVVR